MESLTCEKAKCIPIIEYLANLGFKAQYVSGRNHWYFSPLRNENHASFKVNVLLNLYYDFGEVRGGNLIDLGIRLHKCSVAAFLQMLAASNLHEQNRKLKTEAFNFWLIRGLYPVAAQVVIDKLKENPVETIALTKKEIEKQNAIKVAKSNLEKANQQKKSADENLKKVQSKR